MYFAVQLLVLRLLQHSSGAAQIQCSGHSVRHCDKHFKEAWILWI